MEEFPQIQIWLDLLYNKYVPSFEINDETISLLQSYKKKNESALENIRQVNEILQHQVEEYKLESNRIEEITNETKLSLSILKPHVQSKIENISNIAIDLKVKEPNQEYILIAIGQLIRESYKASSSCDAEQKIANRLLDKYEKLTQKCNTFKKDSNFAKSDYESLEAEVESMKQKCAFYTTKAQKYKAEGSSQKKKLEANGFDLTLTHKQLYDDYKENMELQKQLDKIMPKIQAYSSLPSDEDLARIKVEELKQTVKELENLLFHQMFS